MNLFEEEKSNYLQKRQHAYILKHVPIAGEWKRVEVREFEKYDSCYHSKSYKNIFNGWVDLG